MDSKNFKEKRITVNTHLLGSALILHKNWKKIRNLFRILKKPAMDVNIKGLLYDRTI
jgi:hypothetical protein